MSYKKLLKETGIIIQKTKKKEGLECIKIECLRKFLMMIKPFKVEEQISIGNCKKTMFSCSNVFSRLFLCINQLTF